MVVPLDSNRRLPDYQVPLEGMSGLRKRQRGLLGGRIWRFVFSKSNILFYLHKQFQQPVYLYSWEKFSASSKFNHFLSLFSLFVNAEELDAQSNDPDTYLVLLKYGNNSHEYIFHKKSNPQNVQWTGFLPSSEQIRVDSGIETVYTKISLKNSSIQHSMAEISDLLSARFLINYLFNIQILKDKIFLLLSINCVKSNQVLNSENYKRQLILPLMHRKKLCI